MSSDEAREVCKRAQRLNKVVLIGDCHGHLERLDRVLSQEEPFNFFLSVGDVISRAELTTDKRIILDRWKGKGYFVHGNHDDFEVFNPLGLTNEINGLQISGLDGTLRARNFAKDTPNNISFREILYLSHLSNIDILVTHQPPTGIFGGMGEPVLEELLNYLVPKIYIFGHLHKQKVKFHLNTFMISLPMIDNGHAAAYFQGRDLRNLEIILKKGKKFIRV